MSRKKISTTIYVTPEQSERLRLLHERTKVPVAVYIREGIDLVLRQYGHLLPGQLPLERQAERTSDRGDGDASGAQAAAHGPSASVESNGSPLRQERVERAVAGDTVSDRAAGGAASKR